MALAPLLFIKTLGWQKPRKTHTHTKTSNIKKNAPDPKPTLLDWFRQNDCSGVTPVVRERRASRFFEKHTPTTT